MTDLTRDEILEWFPADRCPSCGGVTDDECNDRKACREVLEAIVDCDDPAQLRRLGMNLKMLADAARGKGFELQPAKGNRTW